MPKEHFRVRAVVSGRVQGVWFRQSTVEAAVSAGVTGWVRNLADGRVEAVFEGEPAAVERALEFVRTGPPHAYVENVDVTREPVRGEQGFRVR